MDQRRICELLDEIACEEEDLERQDALFAEAAELAKTLPSLTDLDEIVAVWRQADAHRLADPLVVLRLGRSFPEVFEDLRWGRTLFDLEPEIERDVRWLATEKIADFVAGCLREEGIHSDFHIATTGTYYFSFSTSDENGELRKFQIRVADHPEMYPPDSNFAEALTVSPHEADPSVVREWIREKVTSNEVD